MIYFLESFDFDMDKLTLLPSQLPEYKDKLFMIMVKADWCGHCKTATPEFEKACEILKNDNVIFCYVNVTGKTPAEVETKPLVSKFFKDFRGFPNITSFKNGKEFVKYNGPRKADSFVQFVKEN